MRNYRDKFKDPRWQKKRLEVLQRANWECELCGDNTKSLQIHHSIYTKDSEPWEYPTEFLHCLCENCHQSVTEWSQDIKFMIGSLSIQDLQYLAEEILPDFKFVADLYHKTVHQPKG